MPSSRGWPRIEPELEALSFGGDANQTLIFAAILAEDQVAPRRDGEVVAGADELKIVGLDEQLQ